MNKMQRKTFKYIYVTISDTQHKLYELDERGNLMDKPNRQKRRSGTLLMKEIAESKTETTDNKVSEESETEWIFDLVEDSQQSPLDELSFADLSESNDYEVFDSASFVI